MRHVSRTHRVALIGCSIELIWTPKSKSNTSTPKNQLADILTKGKFTRDEWNHLLNLFNISNFSSTALHCCNGKTSSTRIRRRTSHSKIKTYDEFNSEDAFGRVVFNFIKPGRTWYGYQDPGKSVAVDDRSGKPDRPSPAGYSKEYYGRSWSSQEWKSGAAAHDRSGKPEKTSWDAMQQVLPHHEEPLLDGNAQSVRYGEIIHDGSGKPDSVNYQEEAESETFVM